MARQVDRAPDVRFLCRLVAAAKQDDQHRATLYEIHAIAGAMIDPKLTDAIAHRLRIARIAQLQTVDAHLDAPLRSLVTQLREPGIEHFGGADRQHAGMLGTTNQPVNYSSQMMTSASAARTRACM